jgi:hypothetical protein
MYALGSDEAEFIFCATAMAANIEERGSVASSTKLWTFKTSNRLHYTLTREVLPQCLALVGFFIFVALPNTPILLRVIYVLMILLFVYLMALSLKSAGDDYVTIDAATGSLTWFAERKLQGGKRDIEFQKLVSEITTVNASIVQTRCGKTGGLEIVGVRGFSRLMPSYMPMMEALPVAEQMNQALHDLKGIVTA